jgi:hypothetical protein
MPLIPATRPFKSNIQRDRHADKKPADKTADRCEVLHAASVRVWDPALPVA